MILKLISNFHRHFCLREWVSSIFSALYFNVAEQNLDWGKKNEINVIVSAFSETLHLTIYNTLSYPKILFWCFLLIFILVIAPCDFQFWRSILSSKYTSILGIPNMNYIPCFDNWRSLQEKLKVFFYLCINASGSVFE